MDYGAYKLNRIPETLQFAIYGDALCYLTLILSGSTELHSLQEMDYEIIPVICIMIKFVNPGDYNEVNSDCIKRD